MLQIDATKAATPGSPVVAFVVFIMLFFMYHCQIVQ